MSAARIPPGRRLGPLAWVVSRGAQRAMRTAHPPHLFTTLGRHPSVFRGWLMFAGRLMPGGKMPRHDTELVILRVAHLRTCTYEWEHHVRLGRRAGVDPDRVAAGPSDPSWSPRQRALLAAVDELHATGDLADASWRALREHLDERLAIEFVMLAGHYEMLATFLNTLRIPPDRPRA